MIDEKKITEAVDAYIGYPKEIDEGVSVSMRRDAFRKGAEWFKNALWHDVSKEPKAGERIITEFRDNGISYELDIPYENWECYCAFNNILRWCYLADILPKGGGK